MTLAVIGPEAESLLDWRALTDALIDGHRRARAEITDTFLYRGDDTLLGRSAWIDGMGIAVKSATIFPGNPQMGKPRVNGAVTLYSDAHGILEALVDFGLVTKWKTAGDSLLGARLLARPDARRILIVGAGTQGHALREAYASLFPRAEFSVWNRSPAGAEALSQAFPGTSIAQDLEQAVAEADIVTCATMSTQPVIRGAWLRPGQHLDLIGAFRPDMREADDDTLRRGRIFVDSRETTLEHIGELRIPIGDGIITAEDVQGDFYDIASGGFARQSDEEITVFKNGGGAHLDLMTSRYILTAWQQGQRPG